MSQETNGRKVKLENRLTTLENNYTHLEEKVEKVNKKLNWLLGLFASNLFGIIGGLLFLIVG